MEENPTSENVQGYFGLQQKRKGTCNSIIPWTNILGYRGRWKLACQEWSLPFVSWLQLQHEKLPSEFLPPWLRYHNGLCVWTESKTNPCPLKLLWLRCFISAIGKVSQTENRYPKEGSLLWWTWSGFLIWKYMGELWLVDGLSKHEWKSTGPGKPGGRGKVFLLFHHPGGGGRNMRHARSS